MGIAGLAIGLGFLILAIVIAVALIPDLFDGLFDSAGEFYTATKLKPKVGVDELVCDLRIDVNAIMEQDLDVPILDTFSVPYIAIEPSNSHQYQWFNCKYASQYTALDMLNAGGDIQTNEIFLVFDTVIETKIALIDSLDSNQRVDSALQSHLKKEIKLDAGTTRTPLDVGQTYVISDIPVRDYRLQIFYNSDIITGINDLNSGEPFEGKICDENQVLRNGVCKFVT